MNTATIQRFAKNVGETVVKRSPEILTGIGIAGMITTAVLAAKYTPKALELIEEKKQEKGEELTKLETVEAAWKAYIPPMVTGTMSTICLIGASSVNLRRNAALATAYTISETALREYRDKVAETIGEKKEHSIRDAIAKDRMDKHPIESSEVIMTNKGNTMCFDVFSQRYFLSDIEKLRRSENELNRQMLSDGSITLNDLYDEIGLDQLPIGDRIGWNANKGLLNFRYGSHLGKDGTPCVLLDFDEPGYDI